VCMCVCLCVWVWVCECYTYVLIGLNFKNVLFSVGVDYLLHLCF